VTRYIVKFETADKCERFEWREFDKVPHTLKVALFTPMRQYMSDPLGVTLTVKARTYELLDHRGAALWYREVVE
jgi:hypothetical protein